MKYFYLILLGLIIAGSAFCRPETAVADQPLKTIDSWTVAIDPSTNNCVARLPGDEVDTLIILNRNQKIVLIAAKPDWSMPGGNKAINLQFDDRPPMSIEVGVVRNLVMALLTDDATDQFIKAHNVTWFFPTGSRTAPLSHVGEVIRALNDCQAAQRH